MAEPLLQTDNVRKAFGGLTALDGVSLEVRAGEVAGLIGPNGSGKTTLFNAISGFAAPDVGEVRFDGERIDGLRPDRIARRGLVRTFQASLNPQAMTVMENLLLAPQQQLGEGVLAALVRARAIRRQEEQALERAWGILAQVKLDHQADTPAGSLSGGQKKLLMMGQALMVRPKLLLLDEPVAGVNPRLIDEIVSVIRDLQSQGQNFLIVEHNMQVVRRLCDSVTVLDAGRIIASGDTNDVLNRDEVLRAYLARQSGR